MCSSGIGMWKRARNSFSSSSLSFFCWWVMFRPSPAARQLAQLLVRQVLDQLEQLRVLAEEVLADVGPRLDGVLLELAVHHLAHAPDQKAGLVAGQKRVPVAAP